MADPVSWLMIESGWAVVGSDGEEIGTVDEVTGDDTEDIFNGLAIVSGLFEKVRYVPSELVGTIVEGTVTLTVPASAAERFEEYEEPPAQIEISSEKAGLLDRVGTATIRPGHEDEDRVSLWRKLRVLFGRRG
jgi:hypothetical protein